MKIMTKLGVITLLVPLVIFNSENMKLSIEVKQPSILNDKISQKIETSFISKKNVNFPIWFHEYWNFQKAKLEKEKNLNKESYKIDIANDSYNLNEFSVHSENFVLSEELQSQFDQIINSRVKDFSFYVISLDKQISFGYNPDDKYSTASSIKAPYSLFCYKQLEKGVANLEDIKTYTSDFYSDGSGIMQYNDKTNYTIKELLYNTIHYSDNIGYAMLYNHFGVDTYNDMIDSLGCSYLKLTPYSEWGFASPKEMALVWQEIYNYKDTEYGKLFFDDLLNAKYNFLKNTLPDYQIAHKSGFSMRGYNDHGIVLDNATPYIISIMFPYPEDNDRHEIIFKQIVKLCNDVINEYNDYLQKNDSDIKIKELSK